MHPYSADALWKKFSTLDSSGIFHGNKLRDICVENFCRHKHMNVFFCGVMNSALNGCTQGRKCIKYQCLGIWSSWELEVAVYNLVGPGRNFEICSLSIHAVWHTCRFWNGTFQSIVVLLVHTCQKYGLVNTLHATVICTWQYVSSPPAYWCYYNVLCYSGEGGGGERVSKRKRNARKREGGENVRVTKRERQR